MMKISANGTRRARWDARLGYLRNPQPPALPLCSLYPSGGMVACVDIVVTRIYPSQVSNANCGNLKIYLIVFGNKYWGSFAGSSITLFARNGTTNRFDKK